jgi:hypothetical protein
MHLSWLVEVVTAVLRQATAAAALESAAVDSVQLCVPLLVLHGCQH